MVLKMYKKDIIEELEGYRDIICYPDRCGNCLDYESREHCGCCTKEVVIDD